MNKLLTQSFEKGISFDDYFALSQQYAKEGKTSGEDQSESLVQYSKLNFSRMKRLVKTAKLSEEILSKLSEIQTPQKWLLISESWCGDAAQNLPFFNLMASANENIELRIVFRDENLELMDEYLTNGGRSIPKLIAFTETEEIFNWGPRPEPVQIMVNEYKALPEPKIPYSEFSVDVQTWYNADGGKSIQSELQDLIQQKSLV